jgi:hypothetical protein
MFGINSLQMSRLLPVMRKIRQNVYMSKPIYSYFILFAWLSAVLVSACTPSKPPIKPWREELTVIVAQGESSVDTEFEQQLVSLFAKQLQVKIKLLPLPLDQITPSTRQ